MRNQTNQTHQLNLIGQPCPDAPPFCLRIGWEQKALPAELFPELFPNECVFERFPELFPEELRKTPGASPKIWVLCWELFPKHGLCARSFSQNNAFCLPVFYRQHHQHRRHRHRPFFVGLLEQKKTRTQKKHTHRVMYHQHIHRKWTDQSKMDGAVNPRSRPSNF